MLPNSGSRGWSGLKPRLKKLVTDLSIDTPFLKEALDVSEPRACRVEDDLDKHSGTIKSSVEDEKRLATRIIKLARQFGCCGCRRVTSFR